MSSQFKDSAYIQNNFGSRYLEASYNFAHNPTYHGEADVAIYNYACNFTYTWGSLCEASARETISRATSPARSGDSQVQ